MKAKKIISTLTAAILLFSSVPNVFAQTDTDTKNDIGETEKTNVALNPDYIEYLYDDENESGVIPSTLDLSYLSAAGDTDKDYPSSYDLRDYGRVPTVRDQGDLGTCWTFSALDSAESQLVGQFPQIELSNRHLAWFSFVGDEQSERDNETQNLDTSNPDEVYNKGGYDNIAISTLSSWQGVVSTDLVPYNGTPVDESLRFSSDYHLTDAYILSNNHTEECNNQIKELVMEKSAVGVSYYTDEDYYSNDSASFYRDIEEATNHAVLLIGWDDNYSKDNFTGKAKPEHDGAWLIQNSWGTNWAQDGYFWISYEDATLGFDAVYMLEDNDNYQTNYQYDTLGWVVSGNADNLVRYDNDTKKGLLSNIFTAEETQQLEAVSFYTTDVNTKYSVSVYTDVEDAKPNSGTPAYKSKTDIEEYAGYHTVKLDEAVKINKGEKFSVVISLENESYNMPFALEGQLVKYTSQKPEYIGNGGESFYSYDGKEWEDVTTFSCSIGMDEMYYALTVTNACIKAFANPISNEKQAVKTVSFSLLEGGVAMGTSLELTGEDDIFYTVNGGEEKKYNGEIIIDEPSTISAWSVKNGVKGNATTKAYTKAASMLQDITVNVNGEKTVYDLLDNETSINITAQSFKSFSFKPVGTDTITVDGKQILSNTWSTPISLNPENGTYTLVVTSSAEGKESTAYTISITPESIVSYDYKNETVNYNDTAYTLRDSSGNPISDGDVITNFIVISEDDVMTGTLTNNITDETSDFSFPKRPSVSAAAKINYENETTYAAISDEWEYSFNEDMSEAIRCSGKRIPLIPGENLYLKRLATDYSFESICIIEVPQRPEEPDVEVFEVTPIEVVFSNFDNCEFKLDKASEWQTQDTATDLDPDTAYFFNVRTMATDNSFASKTKIINVTTPEAAEVNISLDYNGETMLEYIEYVLENDTEVYADIDWLAEQGFVLADDEQLSIPVTVTRKDTKLTCNVKELTFNVKPTCNPADFYYTVVYFGGDGNFIMRSDPISFGDKLEIIIDDIEIPYGYDFTNDYANEVDGFCVNALIYQDEWFKYLDDVKVVLRKIPYIEITYTDENGNKLDKYNYTAKLYEEGDQKLTVTVPDGYEAVNGADFTIPVTSDEYGNLSADVTAIEVTLKQKQDISSSNSDPSSDSESSSDTENSSLDDTKNSSSTPDYSSDTTPPQSTTNPHTGAKELTVVSLIILPLAILTIKRKSDKSN